VPPYNHPMKIAGIDLHVTYLGHTRRINRARSMARICRPCLSTDIRTPHVSCKGDCRENLSQVAVWLYSFDHYKLP